MPPVGATMSADQNDMDKTGLESKRVSKASTNFTSASGVSSITKSLTRRTLGNSAAIRSVDARRRTRRKLIIAYSFVGLLALILTILAGQSIYRRIHRQPVDRPKADEYNESKIVPKKPSHRKRAHRQHISLPGEADSSERGAETPGDGVIGINAQGGTKWKLLSAPNVIGATLVLAAAGVFSYYSGFMKAISAPIGGLTGEARREREAGVRRGAGQGCRGRTTSDPALADTYHTECILMDGPAPIPTAEEELAGHMTLDGMIHQNIPFPVDYSHLPQPPVPEETTEHEGPTAASIIAKNCRDSADYIDVVRRYVVNNVEPYDPSDYIDKTINQLGGRYGVESMTIYIKERGDRQGGGELEGPNQCPIVEIASMGRTDILENKWGNLKAALVKPLKDVDWTEVTSIFEASVAATKGQVRLKNINKDFDGTLPRCAQGELKKRNRKDPNIGPCQERRDKIRIYTLLNKRPLVDPAHPAPEDP